MLDLCAAPGGKTTHLAALMGDEGEIVAVEKHPGRARALGVTARRMRASSVRVVVGDATAFRDDDGFDRVLLDPPCSGLGTLRSHPDLRLRVTPRAVALLAAGQDALLAAARRALRPGGRLVYSVCTISPAEERLAAAATPYARTRTRTAPTASILPGMEADLVGSPARPAASPGCVRRTSPADTGACTACTGSNCVRPARNCGEHSTIVRMSSTATLTLQPLRRSMLVEV